MFLASGGKEKVIDTGIAEFPTATPTAVVNKITSAVSKIEPGLLAKNWIWIVLIILIILAVLGYFVYKGRK